MVSIIIPTYNRAHFIGETLDSVNAQTYQNWECIVIDDRSTDYTEELMEFYCREDQRIRYILRPNSYPKGANSCRNLGFEWSIGKYIQWFDSDDVMLEDFLNFKVKAFKEQSLMTICSGYYTNHELKDWKAIFLEEKKDLFKEFVLWSCPIFTPSVLFKKEFLEKVNLFSLKISRGQETEFFSRIFFNLPREYYVILDLPLFLYRQHSQTISAGNVKYIKAFKESQSYITVENLKRSSVLQDQQLFSHLYKNLITLFFLGIKNDDLPNSKYILKNLSNEVKWLNGVANLKILIVCNILLFFRKDSYRGERYLKKIKIFK